MSSDLTDRSRKHEYSSLCWCREILLCLVVVLCLNHDCEREENSSGCGFLSPVPAAGSEVSVDALWKPWRMNAEGWPAQRRIAVNLNCNDGRTREWMLSWRVFIFSSLSLLCSPLSQKSGCNVCSQPEWHYQSSSFYIVCLPVQFSRIFNKRWDTRSQLPVPAD